MTVREEELWGHVCVPQQVRGRVPQRRCWGTWYNYLTDLPLSLSRSFLTSIGIVEEWVSYSFLLYFIFVYYCLSLNVTHSDICDKVIYNYILYHTSCCCERQLRPFLVPGSQWQAVSHFLANFTSFKIYSINVSLSAGHIIGQRYVTYQRKPISKCICMALKTHAVAISKMSK